MKPLLKSTAFGLFLLLGGCGVLDSVAGIAPDGSAAPGVADDAIGVIGAYGPWGAGIAAVLGGGLALYRLLRKKSPPKP